MVSVSVGSAVAGSKNQERAAIVVRFVAFVVNGQGVSLASG